MDKAGKTRTPAGTGQAGSYHHDGLRAELVARGLEALEAAGAEALSLRALAKMAGVSKAAPYRHFRDRDAFLVALADEGYRLLCGALEADGVTGRGLPAMGRAYMAFAVSKPALYRLMNSELVRDLPPVPGGHARRSMEILGTELARAGSLSLGKGGPEASRYAAAAAAAWAYIHGLVMLRIDGLFPAWLPEPDWDGLAGELPPEVAAALGHGKPRRG